MVDVAADDPHRVLLNGCPGCGYQPHPMPDTARRLRATLEAWQQSEDAITDVVANPAATLAALRVRDACRTARAQLEALLGGGDPVLDGWDAPRPTASFEDGDEHLVAHEVATEMGATAHAFEMVEDDEWAAQGHHGTTPCTVEMLARHLLHEVEHLAHGVRNPGRA